MESTLYRIESLPAPPDIALIKHIFGLIDLTSLSATDNEKGIQQFTAKVNKFQDTYTDFPNVAGICVYPVFLETLNKHLLKKEVDKVIVAGNFPNAHTHIDIKLTEIEWLCQQGADEIDVVFPIRHLFTEQPEMAEKELLLIKSITRNRKLKVILEASLLSKEQLRTACQISFNANADFIKTSTGKEGSVASLEATQTMCKEIKQHYHQTGKKVGIKPAGGIRTFQSAYHYYTLVEEVLGKDWLNKAFFRIGASGLANDLLENYAHLSKNPFTKYF